MIQLKTGLAQYSAKFIDKDTMDKSTAVYIKCW